MNKLKSILKRVKVDDGRLPDRQTKHLGEHIDNAMTELAYAANIVVELLEHQSKSRRKNDRNSKTGN